MSRGSDSSRMNNRELRAARDAADWQILLGTLAGVGLGLWRLLIVIGFLLGEEPLVGFGLLALVEAALCFALAYGVRRGNVLSAISLAALLLLGWVNAWVQLGRVPLGGILPVALVAAGLVQGIRGTVARRRLAGQRAVQPPLDAA